LPPFEELTASRGACLARYRKLPPARAPEILPAVHAVEDAILRCPAPREDAVYAVPGDDLAMHRVHEVEVVWTERAGNPQRRIGPVSPRRAVRSRGDPVR